MTLFHTLSQTRITVDLPKLDTYLIDNYSANIRALRIFKSYRLFWIITDLLIFF